MAECCADIAQQVDFDEYVVCGLWQCEALRASQKANGDPQRARYVPYRRLCITHFPSDICHHRIYACFVLGIFTWIEYNQLESMIPEIVFHYNDVIMGPMASQITSITIVYSTVYLGADKKTHQSSVQPAFVSGIDRRPVNSPHKRSVTRKTFPFDDVIMVLFLILHRFIIDKNIWKVYTFVFHVNTLLFLDKILNNKD